MAGAEDQIIAELMATIRDAITVAFEKVASEAEQRGVDRTRAAIVGMISEQAIPTILGSASNPLMERRGPKPGVSRAEYRAPRGIVSDAIREVLTVSPGLRAMEIEMRVKEKHPEIHEKSVSNQLRRLEGKEYVRQGRYEWFLRDNSPEGSVEPTSEADSTAHQQLAERS